MISVAVEIDEAATQVTADIVDLVEIAVATILTREDADTNDGTLSVTVLLTSDDRLRQLNRDYADDDYVTDVLSFGNDEFDEFPSAATEDSTRNLGDIAISIPQTRRQAREKHQPFERELAMLAIHGTLHLLGYDHATPDEEKVMFGKTDDALARIFDPFP